VQQVIEVPTLTPHVYHTLTPHLYHHPNVTPIPNVLALLNFPGQDPRHWAQGLASGAQTNIEQHLKNLHHAHTKLTEMACN
jgi:hypothetical protein